MPIPQTEVPEITDYQFHYRGLTIGQGTVYDIIQVDGLEDLNIRVGDRDFPRSHGQIPGTHLASFRVINFDLEVNGVAGTAAHNKSLQDLLSVLSPDQGETDGSEEDEDRDKLYWKFPGSPIMFIRCRPARRRIPRRSDTEYGYFPVTFQLRSADPRKYKAEINDSGNQTTYFDVVNAGDAKAYPVIFYRKTVSGTTGQLRNETTDTTFELENIGMGGIYVCDMDSYIRGANFQTIQLSSVGPNNNQFPIWQDVGVNKYGSWKLPRKPFYLVPGTNRLVGFYATDTVRVFWYDTWM